MNRYDRRSAASIRRIERLRFDDSLKTILSADATTGFGAQSAWRQLVDLAGRRRLSDLPAAIGRLGMLRGSVPAAVRAASGRALAFAHPPALLVGFFAEDDLAIAAPVLRTAILDADDWVALLPRLSPAGRSVLRHRRDLPVAVVRALESFGSTDFVIHHQIDPATMPAIAPAPDAPPPDSSATSGDMAAPSSTETPTTPEAPTTPEIPAATATPANDIAPGSAPPRPDAPLSETSFVPLGTVARGLPVVAEALRRQEAASPPSPGPNGFVISDLVARIDAFNRTRPEPVAGAPAAPSPAEGFRFETDAAGVIRWVQGIGRAVLIGVDLGHASPHGPVRIDAAAGGALRRRADFSEARLEIGGDGDAAGSWRLSGIATFEPRSGRFSGFRGIGRRPRRDQSATRPAAVSAGGADSLRQLVHELRTPTNAIAGFAELIGSELLGPVPLAYRDRAQSIHAQATDLIGAIEDLDTAARIESGALDLRPTMIALAPLMARVVADLAPLAAIRSVTLVIEPATAAVQVIGDDRAVERLLSRLTAALVAAGGKGESIAIATTPDEAAVAIRFDRPRALGMVDDATLLSLDGDGDTIGAPLLGTGFALRLARNLATELGGGLSIAADHLTLRLPMVVDRTVGQASTN